MKTDKRILAIFGDGNFPIRSSKLGDIKYKRSVSNIMAFLAETAPDKVYIIPDTESCILAAICCNRLDIKTILVSPFPGFFNGLSKRDKGLLLAATNDSHTFIVLSEEVKNKDDALDLIQESVEYCIKSSSAVAYLRSEMTTKHFKTFMENTATAESKTYFDLAYDSRKVLSE